MKSFLKITLGFLWTIIIVFFTWLFSYKSGYDAGYKSAVYEDLNTSLENLGEYQLNDVTVPSPKFEGNDGLITTHEVSQEDALAIIKDNYGFYEKHLKYSDIQLRRVGQNIFDVSVNECNTNIYGGLCKDKDVWDQKIRKLTVYSDGRYDYD